MSIQIQTAYNVVIDYKTSTSWKRTMAYLIDFLFVLIWYMLCISSFVSSHNLWNEPEMLYILFVFIPIGLYDLVLEVFNNGQSIGKKLLKMRVINLDGTRPAFATYVLRWIFRPIDFTLTLGSLAFILVGITKNSQRLGDLVAGTTVIDLEAEGTDKSYSIKDIIFNDQYQLTYPNILSLLSDKDIRIVMSVVNGRDVDAQLKLAAKLEEVTGYTYDKTQITGLERYLRTILSDYNYLATQTGK